MKYAYMLIDALMAIVALLNPEEITGTQVSLNYMAKYCKRGLFEMASDLIHKLIDAYSELKDRTQANVDGYRWDLNRQIQITDFITANLDKSCWLEQIVKTVTSNPANYSGLMDAKTLVETTGYTGVTKIEAIKFVRNYAISLVEKAEKSNVPF